jgi:galactokinase
MATPKKLKTSNMIETEAKELFKKTFHGDPTVVVKAPGRVNLIGEHTDYSEGFCFPVAINLATVCCLKKAAPGTTTSTLVSVQSPQASSVFEIGENAKEEWGKYVAGVAAQYEIDFAVEASFASDVPLGGGLSSSAALDVSFATALEQLIDPSKNWDASERALKCVEGDHTFVGVVSFYTMKN